MPVRLITGFLFIFVAIESFAADVDTCTGYNDLLLSNGKIITVNDTYPLASSIRIQGNRIVALDSGVAGECTQVINLKGKTVIPGLIDHHNHWLGRASRPGHHVAEFDTVFSIDEAIQLFQEKSLSLPAVRDSVSVDDFITVIGGALAAQFKERRLPNMVELDRGS